jgi:hypothetical protein
MWNINIDSVSEGEKANRIDFGLNDYSYVLPFIFSFIVIPWIDPLAEDMNDF